MFVLSKSNRITAVGFDAANEQHEKCTVQHDHAPAGANDEND